MCVCSVMFNPMVPLPSPLGSSVCGIIQARILEGLPFPPAGDLPDPGITRLSPVAPSLAGGFFASEPPGSPETHLLSPSPELELTVSDLCHM